MRHFLELIKNNELRVNSQGFQASIGSGISPQHDIIYCKVIASLGNGQYTVRRVNLKDGKDTYDFDPQTQFTAIDISNILTVQTVLPTETIVQCYWYRDGIYFFFNCC